MEETGLAMTDVHFVWACSHVWDSGVHQVIIFMRGTPLEVCSVFSRGMCLGYTTDTL